jgi:hypothetical protein
MKYLESIIQKISASFSQNSGYLALLVASLLSYGLIIPRLGFYMDDWPYIFYAFNKGIPSLQEMLLYDSRPYAAWLYIAGFHVLGFKPIAWHMMSLLLRWAMAVSLWKLLQAIWPNRSSAVLQISLLFSLYPFFIQSPSPIAYTHIWFGFLSLLLSFWLTVRAYNSRYYKTITLTVLAMIFEAAHLFTGEYFSGLEFTRVFILWILISRKEVNLLDRIKQVFINWVPYLLVIAYFTYWRTVIYKNPFGLVRNTPVVLQQLFHEPLEAISFLVNSSINDALSVLVLGWQRATSLEALSVASPYEIFRFCVAVVSFCLAYFYFRNLKSRDEDSSHDWGTGSLSVAITALMIGGLPIWLIGRSISESINFDSASRFGIPTTLGASLLLFLVVDYLITDQRRKILFISFLMALAVNFQLNNARQFQNSWEKQQTFSQQLIWRAPTLKPGTAILTDEEILGFMGDYSTSFSVATSYQINIIDGTAPYWYFPFYYTNPNLTELLQGTQLKANKLSMHFEGSSKQMILVAFNPEMKRCLWVLQPQDSNLRLVSEDMRQVSLGSNVKLIEENSGIETSLPEQLYGKQNTKTWCYYFQKADLARQYGRWSDIPGLWNEATSVGLSADNGYEYIPFIEGYAHSDDWGQVNSLAKSANKITPGLEPSLCAMVDRLAATTPESESRNNTLGTLKNIFKCSEV